MTNKKVSDYNAIKIGFKEFKRSLIADLVGKDSFRGVTNTYSWLANQWGHFALGFILVLIFNRFFSSRFFNIEPEYKTILSGLSSALTWLGFEIWNYTNQMKMRNYTYDKTNVNMDIKMDTGVDIAFFWIGAYTATFHLAKMLNLEIKGLSFLFQNVIFYFILM